MLCIYCQRDVFSLQCTEVDLHTDVFLMHAGHVENKMTSQSPTEPEPDEMFSIEVFTHQTAICSPAMETNKGRRGPAFVPGATDFAILVNNMLGIVDIFFFCFLEGVNRN